MSINTVLTSRQTSFKNYFQDGITIPKNGNCALTKFSMDVPVFKQTVLGVPVVDPGDRTNNFLEVCIDGIRKDITWRDFFNAFVDYPTVGATSAAEQDITEDDFYNGTYEFFLNNNLYLSTDNQNFESKCPVMWAVARSITEAFEFYETTNISEYDDSFTDIPRGNLSADYAGGLVNYTRSYIRASNPTKYAINVSYNPNARTLATTTETVFGLNDSLNWTPLNNTLTSQAAGINVAYGNTTDIDLNGGYMRVSPNLAATGQTAFGYCLTGRGNGATDKMLPKVYATIDDATPIIDIGIKFEYVTVGGQNYFTYKIIDGQEQYIHYDGADHSVENYSIYKPYDCISRFEAGDRFAIICRRGNILNSQYEYVFDVAMGDGLDVSTYKVVYTSRKTLNNPNVQIVPTFLSNNVAGNIFTGINYVAEGLDTANQAASIQRGGGSFLNTFTLGVSDDLDNDKPDYRDFYNGLGLNYRTSGNQLVPDINGFILSYTGNPTNKVIEWSPAIDDNSFSGYLQTYYWIGERSLSNMFTYSNDIGFNAWVVDPTLALRNLPKYLDVFLLNHTSKNYTGSFITNGLISSMDGEDRLVGTIPFPQDIPISQVVSIQYETFNPYYRPFNNPEPYITNEFIIEVSYKDFINNTKKTISNITGTLRLELNFNKSNNQNVKRLTARNDLLPII